MTVVLSCIAAVLIAAAAWCSDCDDSKAAATAAATAAEAPAPKNAEPRLVWSDEFDGSRLDESKWSYQIGDGCEQADNACGWGNNEMQYYRKENAVVAGGVLTITAKHEHFHNSEFTSARLRTKGLAKWKYGRFEIRAKVPAGRGTWPAIWMLPERKTYSNQLWPDNGEIDIMEHVGYDPEVIHASTHSQRHNWMIGTQKTQKIKVEGSTGGFHVYSLDWSEDKIVMAVDGKSYFELRNDGDGWKSWPFDQEFHLLLNLAVGGVWGGAQGVDWNAFPQEFVIDYVRVYR